MVVREKRYGNWLAILLMWIGAWSLIDSTIQKFLPNYYWQLLVYCVLFLFGTFLFVVT
jgi:hypothetical protein